MKKWIWVIALLFSTVCFAGERNMIRNFDKNGLKDLNNQLKKQEKLIQKLTKQLQDGGTITSKKTVQTQEDFVSETVLEGASTTVDSIPAVGIARDDGRLELYTNEDENDIINIEPSSYVHETQAKIAVPSSYFLDLRGNYVDADEQRYTADVLVLHDASGNTVTLTNIDETNKISTAGPIAGGRDQSAAFGAPCWLYFFIIYNPTTGDVSSLSSESATAPTLPTGYTFFVRVGSVYLPGSGNLSVNSQINDQIYTDIGFGLVFIDTGPSSAGALESVDISAYIPPTAKAVTGMLGGTVADATIRGVQVSSDSGGTKSLLSATIKAENRVVGYGPGSSLFFTIPVITAQTIWWTASSTGSIYGMYITAYQDDL